MEYYWKAWYDDEASYTGCTQEEWDLLPSHGIMQVKEFRPNTSNLIHHGLDYFWFEDGKIISTNRVENYAIRIQGVKSVKIGRWVNNHVYENAVKEGTSPSS